MSGKGQHWGWVYGDPIPEDQMSKGEVKEIKEREHIPSPDCWCEPELIGDYESEGGVKHYLHKEIQ